VASTHGYESASQAGSYYQGRLMAEEINFAYEGGLYGEFIHNRSFKGEGGFSL